MGGRFESNDSRLARWRSIFSSISARDFGSEAPKSLADIELKIDRHLASLLSFDSNLPPMPSLRLIQAPVFHGYSLSVWIEFEHNPGVDALSQALATGPIEVREGDEEPP